MLPFQAQRRRSLFTSSAKTSYLTPRQTRHLSDAAFSANRRVVLALLKSNDDGMVPTLLADAFRTSADGRAEVADVMAELRRRDPVRATQLLQKLAFTRQETSDLSGLMSDFDREDGVRPAPIDGMLRLAADNGGSVPGYLDPNDPNTPGGGAPDTEESEPDPEPEEERDCSDYEDAVDEAKLAFDDAKDEVDTRTMAVEAAVSQLEETMEKLEQKVGDIDDAFEDVEKTRDNSLAIIEMLQQDTAIIWLGELARKLRRFHRRRNGLTISRDMQVLSYFARHREGLADENAGKLETQLELFEWKLEALNSFQADYADLQSIFEDDTMLVSNAKKSLSVAEAELEDAVNALENAREQLRDCVDTAS